MNQIIHTVQDLTYLDWSRISGSSGTAGSFLKAREDTPSGTVYYKLSRYNASEGVIGHESVNEIIADRLLTILGIPRLHYQLIHADIIVDGRFLRTWLCASLNFKQPGERKIPLDTYYESNRKDVREKPLDFCVRNGWSEYIYQMLVVDFLILNRDRHGANVEVLANPFRKTVRLAPLFDHGLSLFCSTFDSAALESEDVMADKAIQCFVGTHSAWKNLQLIPSCQYPALSPLQESDRDVLLDGLSDALDERWLARSWEMIWRRWLAYEALCHQR